MTDFAGIEEFVDEIATAVTKGGAMAGPLEAIAYNIQHSTLESKVEALNTDVTTAINELRTSLVAMTTELHSIAQSMRQQQQRRNGVRHTSPKTSTRNYTVHRRPNGSRSVRSKGNPRPLIRRMTTTSDGRKKSGTVTTYRKGDNVSLRDSWSPTEPRRLLE